MAKWQPTARPWIVCAANRNSITKVIVCGARHFDRLMKGQVEAMAPPEAMIDKDEMLKHWCNGWSQSDQGFVDQFGGFHNRKDALELALQNGQCLRNSEATFELYSEDLY